MATRQYGRLRLYDAEAPARLQGRFVLCLNDRPTVREIFSAFKFKEVGLSCRINGSATAAREVIITNER